MMESDQRGAGEAGSPPPNPLRLVTSGGREVAVSMPELRLGNTGSMRGWRDSSGGLPPIKPELVLEGACRGGIGGGGDESLGGSGGILPIARGFGGKGGGFPTGIGGIE